MFTTKTNYSSLTTLPGGVAQFQVSAGASRVLLGSVGAAQDLNLAVEGLQSGVDLHVVLPKRAGGLIGPHVSEGIRGLLSLTQTGKGRYVNSRAGRTRRAWRSSVTRSTLRENVYRILVIRYAKLRWQKTKKCHTQRDQLLQYVHEVQGGQWGRPVH